MTVTHSLKTSGDQLAAWQQETMLAEIPERNCAWLI